MTPTGNPAFDAILLWLTDGGRLTSTMAAAAIAAIVRWGLLPAAKALMEKRGKPLSAQSIVYLAYVFSVLSAVGISLFDPSGVTITTAIAVGLAAGAGAIGIHQTGKVPAEVGTLAPRILLTAERISPACTCDACLDARHSERHKAEADASDLSSPMDK